MNSMHSVLSRRELAVSMVNLTLVAIDHTLERRRCGLAFASVDKGATQQGLGFESPEAWTTEFDLNQDLVFATF